MRKLATKIAKTLQKKSASNVIALAELRQMKLESDAAVASIKTASNMVANGTDPEYAVYMQTQNLLSVLIEGLLDLDELSRFHSVLSKAEDEYMPSRPPHSPVTVTYYFGWSSFDLVFGLNKESLASIVYDLQHILKLDPTTAKIFDDFHRSSMRMYQWLGVVGGRVKLRDLLTGESFLVTNQSGFLGGAGEIWFVRLLPSFINGPDHKICFGTPYVVGLDAKPWCDYFDRASWRQHSKNLDCDALLKFGLAPCFWLEYIMQGYYGVSPRGDAIFLTGLPDIGVTRPHFSTRHIKLLPEAR